MGPSLPEIEQISLIGSSINLSEWSQTECHQRQRGSPCGSVDGSLQKYRICTRRLPISSRYISLLISAGRRKNELFCWELFCRAPGMRGRCSGWIGSFHRLNISPLISQVESQIPIAFGDHSRNLNLGSFGPFFLRLKSLLKKWGAMLVESGGVGGVSTLYIPRCGWMDVPGAWQQHFLEIEGIDPQALSSVGLPTASKVVIQ